MTDDSLSPGLRTTTFYTVAEVAELMRVSRMTVYRLVHSGKLPAARIGRGLRVPDFEISRYIGRTMAFGGSRRIRPGDSSG